MKEELDRLCALLSQQLQNPEAVSRYEKLQKIKTAEEKARRLSWKN